MSLRFLCIGECMIEMSETKDGTYRKGYAGDTFNVAWYARRVLEHDWTVGYGTCVGRDAPSEDLLTFMDAQDVDTSAIRRVPDRTLGLYMISLLNGERSFCYWRDRSAARLLADDAEWLQRITAAARHIHFSGITLAILTPEGRDRLFHALAQARAGGTTVSFDTNIRPQLWHSADETRAALTKAAEHSDIVLPSFDEEQVAFGDATPSATAARYLSAGARIVVVKNGAGAVVLQETKGPETRVEVPDVRSVVDTTAAGDSFAGTFLAHWLSGAALDISAEHASAVSARVIGERGALVPG